MGDEPSLVAVADAGPLIHLHEVGHLFVLGVFPQVYIPQAVWEEAVVCGTVPEADLKSCPAVTRRPVAPEAVVEMAELEASGLQHGESECLALCRSLSAPVFLTDDLAARDAAKRLQIRPVGSLGVIVLASHRGLVTRVEAASALERLYSVSSLFVTRTIVELAIKGLDQPP